MVMGEGDDENECTEDVGTLPYYRQPQPPVRAPRVGFLAKIWGCCLSLVIVHFAVYLVLGIVSIGGIFLIKALRLLGWHGPLTILADALLVIVYLAAVIFVVLGVSYLGKKVTGDKNF